MTVELVIFIILAVIAIAAAAGMLLSKNAVYSVVFLILNFAVIAVFYLLLGAPFIAMVQVTVYAGAIMVLFMFVVMLLGAERLTGPSGVSGGHMLFAGVLLLALLATSSYAVSASLSFTAAETPLGALTGEAAEDFGSPTSVGLLLFSRYIFPFEVIALLLLVAMIGAVVLAKEEQPRIDVRALQQERRTTQSQAILEKQLRQYQATQGTNGNDAESEAVAGSEEADEDAVTETADQTETGT